MSAKVGLLIGLYSLLEVETLQVGLGRRTQAVNAGLGLSTPCLRFCTIRLRCVHGASLGPTCGCSVASLGSIEFLQQRFESSRQTADLFDWSGHLFSVLGNVCRFCGKEASAPDEEVPQRPGP